MIQYISHQFSDQKMKWPTIEREAFAIIYSLEKLRPIVIGTDITVFTDHKPLKHLFTSEMKNPASSVGNPFPLFNDILALKINTVRQNSTRRNSTVTPKLHTQIAPMLDNMKIVNIFAKTCGNHAKCCQVAARLS